MYIYYIVHVPAQYDQQQVFHLQNELSSTRSLIDYTKLEQKYLYTWIT